jgi:hypothetical protein
VVRFTPPRRRKLIAALAQGKNITEAEKIAGFSTKYPGQSGSQALRHMQMTMPEVLEAAGLTDAALIEKYLKPLLIAKETKFFQHKGRVVSKRNVPALGTRTQALDLAFKLKGSYAPPAVEQTNKTVSVIVLDVPRPPRPGSAAKTVIEVEPTSGSVTSPVRDVAANGIREPLPPAK